MGRIRREFVYTLLWFITGERTLGLWNNTGDNTFSIQHEDTGKCFLAQKDSLILGNCSSETAKSWKWGSEHRLFHTGLLACLGLDVVSKTLSLTDCSSSSIMEWRCYGGFIFTTYQMKLSVTNGMVTAKRNTSDSWRRGGTAENICEQPYQTMHTSGGNANGAPCKFPFLYNGKWYHNCLPMDAEHPHDWCSTTDKYEEEQQWGNCLKYEEGCGTLWSSFGTDSCYQVVSTALVTWHEARDACRSQGGDLLSISSPEDLQQFKERTDLPEQLWIGLNQLDWMMGWQWSDGSPLAYIPWKPENTFWKEECGVMTANLRFRGETCERRLPYICEKKENSTQATATVKVVYQPTECESGWISGQGFCYKLYGNQTGDQKSYTDAQQVCMQNSAQLASIHTLDDIEMFNTHFTEKTLTAWIGLKAENNTLLFKWADGTNVSISYWARYQPPLITDNTIRCVILDKYHMWSVIPCYFPKAFICKKKGKVNESIPENSCPKDGEWRRHGNSCYKVDTQEVLHKNSCKIIINNRFEQTFINSLLKEHVSNKPQYFWTGLQDIKGIGEYHWSSQDEQETRVTFDNWKWGEPAKLGGCVVMTTNPLGQWMVKNCTEFKAGSVCKRSITAEPSTPPSPDEPDLNATCPSGWVTKEGVGYCYKVFHEERISRKRTWEEAKNFCEGLGTHLASFTDLEEMNLLNEILRESISNDRYFWVGLNRRNPNNDNRWEWSDGRPVSTMIFPQEFHEDDEYNRDCTAFKSLKRNYMLVLYFLMTEVPKLQFYPRAFHCDAKLEWVCQIPRGETPKTPEWYKPDGHHETSIIVDEQEFWFVTKPTLSYQDAKKYCGNNHSKLATVKTINSAIVLHNNLFKLAGTVNWWVDYNEHGHFIPSRLSRLHPFLPTWLGKCTSASPGSFIPDYSINCSENQPFVCEVLNVTSADNGTVVHPPLKPCKNNSFRDKCFTVIKPTSLIFKSADETCQTLGGGLLSIRDQAEQDFITTLLPDKAKKIWIGMKLKLHDILWLDNTPVKYLNFNPLLHGQLRPMHYNMFEQGQLELCAYMYNDDHSDLLGTWDYTSCTDEQSVAICQHYTDTVQSLPVSTDTFQIRNHTFQLILNVSVSWYEALELCKEKDMDLASVADAFQQAVLTVNVSKAGFPLWIGLFSKDDEHYHWTDHSHTVFSRWGPSGAAGGCVYLDTDGFWKATDCGEQLKGLICHIPHEDSTSKKKNTTLCPHESNGPNWIPFKNNCYTVLLESSRWQEYDMNNYNNTCQALVKRGNLLTIRDEEENEFIKTQLRPFKDLAKFVWLGIHKSEIGHQMLWYDDTFVQYSNWKDGRPNITEPFMAGLDLNGDWIMIEDKDLFTPFKQRAIVVCKIEKDPINQYKIQSEDVPAPSGYYYHLVPRKMNWHQALEVCGRGGGHLVSIHNNTTNQNMALISKRDGFPLWIGLSRQDYSGWPYEWSDGSRVQFVSSGFGGSGSEEKCVYVNSDGTWTTVNCEVELEGAICYYSIKHFKETAVNDNCPAGGERASWIQFKDHCYAVDMINYNYSVYTMDEAKSVCQILDPSAKLLTINSQEENDFVSRHVAESPLITERVWLALAPSSKEGAMWMDGSELEFSKWNSFHASHDCAVLVSTNGTWVNANCTVNRSRVVCKAPAKSAGTPVALVFFIIVLICVLALAAFVVYKKTRQRYFSSVRYQRNFDDADSTSMIAETE